MPFWIHKFQLYLQFSTEYLGVVFYLGCWNGVVPLWNVHLYFSELGFIGEVGLDNLRIQTDYQKSENQHCTQNRMVLSDTSFFLFKQIVRLVLSLLVIKNNLVCPHCFGNLASILCVWITHRAIPCWNCIATCSICIWRSNHLDNSMWPWHFDWPASIDSTESEERQERQGSMYTLKKADWYYGVGSFHRLSNREPPMNQWKCFGWLLYR